MMNKIKSLVRDTKARHNLRRPSQISPKGQYLLAYCIHSLNGEEVEPNSTYEEAIWGVKAAMYSPDFKQEPDRNTVLCFAIVVLLSSCDAAARRENLLLIQDENRRKWIQTNLEEVFNLKTEVK